MRRPGDHAPEPPRGRAAERLREFVEQRYPGVAPSDPGGECESEATAEPPDERKPMSRDRSGTQAGTTQTKDCQTKDCQTKD